MAMTIDDDIEMLEYIHKNYRGCRMGVALENTMNNLHKYQTIQKIVKSWEDDTWTNGHSYDCMIMISEVLRNGKA